MKGPETRKSRAVLCCSVHMGRLGSGDGFASGASARITSSSTCLRINVRMSNAPERLSTEVSLRSSCGGSTTCPDTTPVEHARGSRWPRTDTGARVGHGNRSFVLFGTRAGIAITRLHTRIRDPSRAQIKGLGTGLSCSFELILLTRGSRLVRLPAAGRIETAREMRRLRKCDVSVQRRWPE